MPTQSTSKRTALPGARAKSSKGQLGDAPQQPLDDASSEPLASSLRWQELHADAWHRRWLALSATHCPECDSPVRAVRSGSDWLVRCQRKTKQPGEKEPHLRPCGWQYWIKKI